MPEHVHLPNIVGEPGRTSTPTSRPLQLESPDRTVRVSEALPEKSNNKLFPLPSHEFKGRPVGHSAQRKQFQTNKQEIRKRKYNNNNTD